MKTKRSKKIFLIIMILIICVGAIGIYKLSQMPLPKIDGIEKIDFSKVADGTYYGHADNSLVKVKVSVTVADGVVSDIEIIRHDNGLGQKAEAITADVISLQSLEVDAISSATYSSNTILKAIENALISQVKE